MLELQAGGQGSRPGSSQSTTPTLLTIDLKDVAGAVYYINERACPLCQIRLAYNTATAAKSTEQSIRQMVELNRRKSPENGELVFDAAVASEQIESTSNSSTFDVSTSLPGQGQEHQPTKQMQLNDVQPKNLVATAARARDLLIDSSKPRLHTAVKDAIVGGSEDQNRAIADLVLMPAHAVELAQKFPSRSMSAYNSRSSKDMSAAGDATSGSGVLNQNDAQALAQPDLNGKLSRKMRLVNDNEPSQLPLVADKQSRPTPQAGIARTMQVPATPGSIHLKRKARQYPASRSSKRPKNDTIGVIENARSNESNGTRDIETAHDEFDIPATPPGPKRRRPQMEPVAVAKGKSNKSKRSKNATAKVQRTRRDSKATNSLKPKAAPAIKKIEGDQNGSSVAASQHKGMSSREVSVGAQEQPHVAPQNTAGRAEVAELETGNRANTTRVRKPQATNSEKAPAKQIPSINSRRGGNVRAAAMVARKQMRMLEDEDIEHDELSQDPTSSMALALDSAAAVPQKSEPKMVQRLAISPSELNVVPAVVNDHEDTLVLDRHDEAEGITIQLQDLIVLPILEEPEYESGPLEAVAVGLSGHAQDGTSRNEVIREAETNEQEDRGDHASASSSRPLDPAHFATSLSSALSGVLDVKQLQPKPIAKTPKTHGLKTKQHSDTEVDLKTQMQKQSIPVDPYATTTAFWNEACQASIEDRGDLLRCSDRLSHPPAEAENTSRLADPRIEDSKAKAKSKAKRQTEESHPETYVISSGTSQESESIRSRKGLSPKPTPQPQQSRPKALQHTSKSTPEQISNELKATMSRSLGPSEHASSKRRASSSTKQTPIKRLKLQPQANMTGEGNNANVVNEAGKDPDRIPQIISFSAKGPRNQGLRSTDRKLMSDFRAQDNEEPDGKRGMVEKQGLHTTELMEVTSNTVFTPKDQRGSNVATVDRSGRKRVTSSDPLSWESLEVAQPQRDEARNTLLLEDEDSAQGFGLNIISQSSRVDENGSPLPNPQATRTKVKPTRQDQGKKRVNGSNDIECFLPDEDITLVHHDHQKILPSRLQELDRSATRKKKVDFIQSGSSKHRLSSPNAPSMFLDEIEPHTVESDGRLVNVETEAVLKAAIPQDPFTSRATTRPTGFLEMLRRVSRNNGTNEQTPKHTEVGKKQDLQPSKPVEDPDKTLVEDSVSESGKRKQKRKRERSTSDSETSTSESESRSSRKSGTEDAALERWQNALEPHQQGMLGILYEISHVSPTKNLIGHVVDAETAIQDIIDDYQRRGSQYIKNLSGDLEHATANHLDLVRTAQGEATTKLKGMSSKVAENLKRKSRAESLAQQIEEERKAMDSKIDDMIALYA
ncbi:MAG: hypothetical protein Q9222_007283 [Ikaeria aurantiellina]